MSSLQEFKSKSILSENDFGTNYLQVMGSEGKQAWESMKQIQHSSGREHAVTKSQKQDQRMSNISKRPLTAYF